METFRDTFLGRALYLASGRRILTFPEEQPGFVVPERYQVGYKEKLQARKAEREKLSPSQSPSTPTPTKQQNSPPLPQTTAGLTEEQKRAWHDRGSPVTTPGGEMFVNAHSDATSIRDHEGTLTPGAGPGPTSRTPNSSSSSSSDGTLNGGTRTPNADKDLEKNATSAFEPSSAQAEEAQQGREEDAQDPYLVDWYGPNDPDNPLNWSQPKKFFVTFLLCFLTFSVYMGSSIITPGEMQFAEEFGVSEVVATLSLTLFVLGYGIGPMFLSSLSEIPSIGRNLPYIATLAIFVILQVPTALTHSLAGYMILRFLAGIFGSPPLATGGATIGDMYDAKHRAQHIGLWGLSAVCGPALGPLIGGFASQALGWRWTIWPILFSGGAALVLLVFALPETSSSNILVRRAARLRQLTGNQELKSPGEVAQANMTAKEVAMMTLVRPFALTIFEPMVFLNNLEIGLVYAILYVWLEAFPLVFVNVYGFNEGENGLALTSILVGAVVTYFAFLIYIKVRLEPLFDKKGGMIDPEDRLELSMGGLIWLPICLFGFGWTATASIHWIVPLIFASFFSIGTFTAFQSVLNYLSDSYPDYIASVLAGNDLFRAAMGAAFPLFARAMFNNLQAKNGPAAFPVAWGCTLLGCLTILFVPLPFIFHRYGPKLRSYSRYASG